MSDIKKDAKYPKEISKAWIARKLEFGSSFDLKRKGIFSPEWLEILNIRQDRYDTIKKFSLVESKQIIAMLKYRGFID